MMQQPYTDEREPAYRLDHASGRFLPANQAAWDEVNAWNEWATARMRAWGTLPAQGSQAARAAG